MPLKVFHAIIACVCVTRLKVAPNMTDPTCMKHTVSSLNYSRKGARSQMCVEISAGNLSAALSHFSLHRVTLRKTKVTNLLRYWSKVIFTKWTELIRKKMAYTKWYEKMCSNSEITCYFCCRKKKITGLQRIVFKWLLMGVLHSYCQISMFCALSQNYQYL